MLIFLKNKNFNFSNFGPQHPAAHGVFTKNKILKNIAINKFFSTSYKSENDQRLRIQEWQNWINNLNSNEIRNIFLENNKIRNFRKQPFEFALFKTLENNAIIPYFLIIPFSDIVSNLVIRIDGNKSYLFNFIKLHNGELVPLVIPFSRSNKEITHFESLFWDNSIGNPELTAAKIFAPEFYNYFINELKKIINNNKKQHLCVCDFYYQTLIKYNEKLYSEFTPLTFIFGELVSLSLFRTVSKFFKMDLSVTRINYGTLKCNACFLSPIPYLAWLAPSPSIRKIILKILIKIGKIFDNLRNLLVLYIQNYRNDYYIHFSIKYIFFLFLFLFGIFLIRLITIDYKFSELLILFYSLFFIIFILYYSKTQDEKFWNNFNNNINKTKEIVDDIKKNLDTFPSSQKQSASSNFIKFQSNNEALDLCETNPKLVFNNLFDQKWKFSEINFFCLEALLIKLRYNHENPEFEFLKEKDYKEFWNFLLFSHKTISSFRIVLEDKFTDSQVYNYLNNNSLTQIWNDREKYIRFKEIPRL